MLGNVGNSYKNKAFTARNEQSHYQCLHFFDKFSSRDGQKRASKLRSDKHSWHRSIPRTDQITKGMSKCSTFINALGIEAGAWPARLLGFA